LKAQTSRKRRNGRSEPVPSAPFKEGLPKRVRLPIRCVVYVPSTQGDKPIGSKEFMDRREHAAQELVKMFGGCRETLAKGRYLNREGEIVEEDVAVLTGYGQPEKYLEKRDRFIKWLLKKKREWGQETLGFEFGSDLYFL
jgi:hypothetical protein